MQYNFRQLRFRILMGVSLLLSLLLAFFAWQAYTSYGTAIDNAEEMSRSYALTLKEHAERSLSEADHTIEDIIGHIERAGGIAGLSQTVLNRLAMTSNKKIPQIWYISIVNTSGQIVATSNEDTAPHPSVADRSHFLHHRDNSSLDIHLSEPIKSRITGTWHFTLSRRLNDRAGKFAGEVVALIDISYFEKIYSSIVSQYNGRASLASLDGNYLVFVPHDETVFATAKKTAPFFRKYVAEKSARTYHNKNSNVGRTYRIVSYQRLDSYPVVAIMSFGHKELIADWRSTTLRHGLAITGVCGLALLMTWLFIIKLRERVETDQVMAQQQITLRENAEQLNLIMESTGDGIYGIGKDGLCIFANTSCLQMLGYDRIEELLGLNMHDLIHHCYPDGTPMAMHDCHIYRSLHQGIGATISNEVFWRRDGTSIPVEYASHPIIKGDQIVGVAISWRDITLRRRSDAERLNLEKQLLHAQKLESLGVLAGGIAHDFNNILTAIIGNAELARLRLTSDSPAQDNLLRIEKSATRAADLARQMLAYSGKGQFVIEAIDLNRLVEEMGHLMQVSISKKATLSYSLTEDLPTIEVDATQLRQIVMNLVINASEAIGDHDGIIAVSTGCRECTKNYLNDTWLADPLAAGLYVWLEIADNGCGMDKDTLAKLFDPFFSTKFTGRGLGMAAVLGIVRGHRGAIKVKSKLNKGTTFTVLLPASIQPIKLSNNETDTDTWSEGGTALLVDDEETILDIGSEMLRELGFNVITARDGREALDIYRVQHEEIRIVILDLTMPRMDGEECFRELHQVNTGVQVIISSGFSKSEVSQKFIGKGLVGFVQKPYRLAELKAVLAEIRPTHHDQVK